MYKTINCYSRDKKLEQQPLIEQNRRMFYAGLGLIAFAFITLIFK